MDEYEQKYVIDVYDKIAPYFNIVKFRPWDNVKLFMDQIKVEDNVVEIGCGNGINMFYLQHKKINCIGIDNSTEQLKFCQKKNLDVIKADITNLPFNNNSFDYTICNAVIHHLSTRERRIQAIKELIRISYIKIFIQVGGCKKLSKNKTDRLVPFSMGEGVEYMRYYHIFGDTELIELINEITNYNFTIEKYDWEMGNWYVILKKF